MKVGKALQDKLARSLDNANKREVKAHRQAPAPLPADKRCTKLSISLFETDRRQVEAIRAFVLVQSGTSISTSQVIKLALRTAPLTKALTEALDQARQEDGRRW
jgi:hypothetical protein